MTMGVWRGHTSIYSVEACIAADQSNSDTGNITGSVLSYLLLTLHVRLHVYNVLEDLMFM